MNPAQSASQRDVVQRRLDILLKRVMPKSYNTFSRRYARAVAVLLHVRNDFDGKLTFTPEKARDCLALYAKGITRAHVLLRLLADALAAARSDAGRKAEGKSRPPRRRVSSGKFAAKIYGLLDAAS